MNSAKSRSTICWSNTSPTIWCCCNRAACAAPCAATWSTLWRRCCATSITGAAPSGACYWKRRDSPIYIVLLQSGCLCCTMRGDLVDALETLLRDLDNRRCTFRRVLLETTGLADPAPVLHTMMSHPYLLLRYRLD